MLSISISFFCFNHDVRLVRQRRLFSGDLPAMFVNCVSLFYAKLLLENFCIFVLE